jgi:hypothetical protein
MNILVLMKQLTLKVTYKILVKHYISVEISYYSMIHLL